MEFQNTRRMKNNRLVEYVAILRLLTACAAPRNKQAFACSKVVTIE